MVTNKVGQLLNEKYRPTKLEDYVGNDSLKSMVSKYLESNDLQNLIFYGPAGTGKTTLAKLLVSQLNCTSLYINASDERGIDTIREKVAGFAMTASFKPLKVIILDEADFLTIQAQASLRNIIEQFSKSTRFIMTCNFVERIIDPLQSRCQVLKVVPPSKGEVARHIAGILTQENTEFTIDDVKSIVNQYYPDMRKALNIIQMATYDSKLALDSSILASSTYMNDVKSELSVKKPSFNKIRQIIADSNVSEYDELFRFLFDNAGDYLGGREGTVAVLISEHQYQSQFRVDKEINIMSLVSKLIELKQNQVIL